MTLTLNAAPSSPVDESLKVREGRYRGWLDIVRWGYPGGWLKGQVLRAFGRKRWFQACLNLGDRIVVMRIMDQGLSGSGALWSVSLPSGEVEIAQTESGVPLSSLVVGPMAGQGAKSYLKSSALTLSVRRGQGERGFWIEAKREGWHLSCSLELGPEHEGLVVIGESAPGKKGLSQRLTGLHVRGTLRTSAGVRALDHADAASLEYVNGFFERPYGWSSALVWPVKAGETWLYASELDRLSGHDESAVWKAGTLVKLGKTPGFDLEELSLSHELTPVASWQEQRGLPEAVADLAAPLSCVSYQHEFILGQLRDASGQTRWGLFEGRLFG